MWYTIHGMAQCGMVWYGVVLYAKDRHGGGEGGGAPS